MLLGADNLGPSVCAPRQKRPRSRMRSVDSSPVHRFHHAAHGLQIGDRRYDSSPVSGSRLPHRGVLSLAYGGVFTATETWGAAEQWFRLLRRRAGPLSCHR